MSDTVIFWSGDFGKRVADGLAAGTAARVQALSEDLLADPAAALDGVRRAVFVANRPLRPSLLRLDEFLWRAGIAWLAC